MKLSNFILLTLAYLFAAFFSLININREVAVFSRIKIVLKTLVIINKNKFKQHHYVKCCYACRENVNRWHYGML